MTTISLATSQETLEECFELDIRVSSISQDADALEAGRDAGYTGLECNHPTTTVLPTGPC